MTKFEYIRAILDSATSDNGRLEDAVELLESYARHRAMQFEDWLNIQVTDVSWYNGNGELKTIGEMYDDFLKVYTF